MDLLPFAAIAIVFSVVGLVVGFLVSEWRAKPSSGEIVSELKGLRRDLETRFGIKFSDKGFSENDAFSLFFAVANALHRFERDSREGETGRDSITEARGYVAILNLILSWAEVNRLEGVKRKAEELLARSEEVLKKTKRL